jgi:putative hydrolase of the HAD superfamily
MTRGVLFDAGGTLIRVRGSVGAVYAGVAAAHAVEVCEDEIEGRFRTAFARMPPLCFPAASPADLPALEREWWKDLVRKIYTGVAFPDFDAYFNDLFEYFADPLSWELFPDVRSALESLYERGVRMGIVSNFDGRLLRICEGLGIASFFDTIALSARVGHAKPDPRIFQIALGPLDVVAGEALHVGDSEEEDVVGAQSAGLRALLIDRYRKRSRPGQIDDLRRVVDLL